VSNHRLFFLQKKYALTGIRFPENAKKAKIESLAGNHVPAAASPCLRAGVSADDMFFVEGNCRVVGY
jgi:hypothetical protein